MYVYCPKVCMHSHAPHFELENCVTCDNVAWHRSDQNIQECLTTIYAKLLCRHGLVVVSFFRTAAFFFDLPSFLS